MKRNILFSIFILFSAVQIGANPKRSGTQRHYNPMPGHITYCKDYHAIQAIVDARNQGDWKTVKRIVKESCGLSSLDSQCPPSEEADHSCFPILFDPWPLPE